MRRHKPLTRGWQVALSESEHPLWGSEALKIILIEGIVCYTHAKEVETEDPRRERAQLRWGKGNPLSQILSKQEIESKVASIYYL